jgi:class 3 adenylate cyclase
MEYRLLGPLEVLDASGQKLHLGGAMQQSVLASLLLRADQTVALERIVDELWEEPPATAARTVQAYVSRLRHELPHGAIESRPGGYAVVLDGHEFDLHAFERLAGQGHAALAIGECERAASLLREAIALWRGPALAGLTSETLRREAERLEEGRLSVIEDRIEADLGSAQQREIVPELNALVAEHPFRERLRAQLMRALYRSGRPGDALALYRETRRLLVEELGMEPGAGLRELEQAILRQDAELEAPTLKRSVARAEPLARAPGPPLAQAAPREVRKTVTVLFCDVVDSTALGEGTDPEVLRALLARYFKQMKSIVELHGGTVEKFIGDAVMAVFGVPVAHEDDALRACRAALEMRESFPELGIEGRIGITTGEVVTGTEERLATGDAVNVAARLEQAAEPGQVFVGEPTLQLVHEEAEVEALEPLALRGKAEPVEAYRLRALHTVSRRHDLRFVGRAQEVAAIQEAWQRALTAKRCEVFTIVGEAGVGKSRLVAEALPTINARAVEGRCLSYGEGITYWPVVEVLKQLGSSSADERAAAAIAAVLGETDVPTSAEEIAWGFRKLLEQQAPLIVVFDDIQWGEETFLDLIEHLALLSSGSPILVLCIARTELNERRPGWTPLLRLQPLADDDVDELIGRRGPAELKERIARVASGNPLFVSEMLAMSFETNGEVEVPPTLRALLVARLDQLKPEERWLIERGAVEGEVFHSGAVQALAPEETRVTRTLSALVRKSLIRTDKPQLPGEDGFRFGHALLQEVAYEGITKSKRAELHERLAAWLDERGAEFVESDEIVGYHLEQAHRYRAELGPVDEAARELASRAADCLARAGGRAFVRNDMPAAAKLLGRAATLLERGDPGRAAILPELGAALGAVGDLARAEDVLAQAVAEARALEGANLVARAVAEQVLLRLFSDPEGRAQEARAEGERLIAALEGSDDDRALAKAWYLVGFANLNATQFADMDRAMSRSLEHADRAADLQQQSAAIQGLASATACGPTQVADGIVRLERLSERVPDGSQAEAGLLINLALLQAMAGRIGEARRLAGRGRAIFKELGMEIWGATNAIEVGSVERYAGDPAVAEPVLRKGCEALQRMGERAFLSTTSAFLAQTLYALERHEEADEWTHVSEEAAAPDDLLSQFVWRSVRAKVLARRGKLKDGERLAKEAVALAETGDMLACTGDALLDLAEVLRLANKDDEARSCIQRALGLYEQKGVVRMAERARALLAEL